MSEKWEVGYARFLNCPPTEVTKDATAACPHLQVRRVTKTCKGNGTWLTASLPADLKLLVDSYNADVVMRVQYRGRIMEEHFISKLNISWPQVSCESDFPSRGTSVVTVTYKDEMEEVQKFAFQFLTVCSLETFLNDMKANMRDARRTLQTNYSSRSDVPTAQSYRFYSRTPLASRSTQDNDPCTRELASISNFNKRRFTSEKFYQQAVVEDSRASSCQKFRTAKPVHQKMMKRIPDLSQNMLESQRFTSNAKADLKADNGNNRALYARSPEKETTDHQSKILISFDESIHIGKKPVENIIDLQRSNEFVSKPIRWHKSSEAITDDSSHYRTPTMANREPDEASNAQNLVPSSSSVELEQCQQNQDAYNNNQNYVEVFPPSFTALLSNCFSSSEQAATPQSPEVVDDLKSQIARYMEDSTFQDMLMKVERVSDELG